MRQLRRALAEQPQNLERALALARRYFDLAGAEGDPRYVGYAEAAIRPWSKAAEPPVEILVMRALLRQYRTNSTQRSPTSRARWSAIRQCRGLVLARGHFAGAGGLRRRTRKLRQNAGSKRAVRYRLHHDHRRARGRSRQAYAELSKALRAPSGRRPRAETVVETRLAEWRSAWARTSSPSAISGRGWRSASPTVHPRRLRRFSARPAGRPAEVVPLLRGWERSDILLLRLALAEQAAKLPSAAAHSAMLKERFDASALRGDSCTAGRSAFHLYLLGDARGALRLAAENYRVQREPRDARILMEAALAAKDPAAAQPALDWLRASGYEARVRETRATLQDGAK